MLKKVISTFLILVLASSCFMTVYAQENIDEEKKVVGYNEVVIDIIQVPEGCTEAEYGEIIKQYQGQNDIVPYLDAGIANMAIMRIGNTDYCDLVFSWTGYMIDGFRYLDMIFSSTSAIEPVEYYVLGNGEEYTYHRFTASTVVSKRLGVVKIPADVTKVKIQYNSPQVYAVDEYAGWYSVVFAGRTVGISSFDLAQN